ncbi:general stress protein [Corynebacterium tapiri]|uniref:general stress protein n=1 Tax=Corynebacterium tapiri TaxID=1448266 RepID=UPI001FE2B6D8|nr:general stress protein [Corynebacterium tapiri]
MATSQPNAQRMNLRGRPSGWPVGSFGTYAEAQKAVDALSDEKFPVEHLAIIGVDLIEVENVLGRLSWGKVLLGGAASGAWLGLFFGLLFSILGGPMLNALLWGILMGAIFGTIMAAVSYGVFGGRRDFTSQTAIVAGRYDVICHPDHATKARDMIVQMGLARPLDERAGAHEESLGQSQTQLPEQR